MRVGQRPTRGPAAAPQLKTATKNSKAPARHATAPLPRTKAASSALSAPGTAASSAAEWDSATLADFTRWNEEAMEALRGNDGATSHRLLTAMLPELRERLRRCEAAGTSAASSDMLQSWRLVYALTLNNYGCQLRRDGQTDAALEQFHAAQAVELAVFGKPSCSTMLNLSAVLLSKGAAKEALAIATECAAAAQDGDPVLFITALHNLAVALGQQPGERSRSAALPTMLQALREAQAALGEQHPTTKMLKAKCGLTSQWIHSTASTPSLPRPESSSVVRRSENAQSARTPSSQPAPQRMHEGPQYSAQDRARAALYTLQFQQSVPATQTGRGTLSCEHNTPSPAVTASSDLRDSWEKEPQRFVSPPVDEAPTLSDAGDVHRNEALSPQAVAAASAHAAEPSPPADVADGAGHGSDIAVSVDRLCLDSANLSVVERSLSNGGLETVLQEPFHPSAAAFGQHGATTLRDLCGSGPNGSVAYPSFLRFSAPLPRVVAPAAAAAATTTAAQTATPFLMQMTGRQASGEGVSVFAHTTPVESRASPRPVKRPSGPVPPIRTAAAPAAATATSSNATMNTLPQQLRKGATETAEAEPRAKRRPLFGQGSAKWSARAAQREANAAEEEVYRKKLRDEEAAAEASLTFERGLAAVKERTRHRAACAIQRAWQQWWSSVGQPRRHVQLQRLEELQRRRRDRLALSSAAGKKTPHASKSHTVTVPPPPSHQHGRIAGFVVPAVVVRCAKKWLARTACVRYVARTTGYAVDARLHEADIHHRLSRVQAVWRGKQQRRKGRAGLGDAAGAAAGDVDARQASRAEAEARDYAAMVIQGAYRRHTARGTRQRLYKARFDAPATRIQQWLRSTWADHQQRGVDAPTLRLRNAAALCVQRVWRGYQGRLAFRMRELRLRIDASNPYALAIDASVEQRPVAISAAAEATSQTAKTAIPTSSAAPPPLSSGPASSRPNVVAAPPQASAYEVGCRARSDAVQRIRDAERDNFYIPLYVETLATKERVAWQESIRLRPTEVLRRRAELNALLDAEQDHFTRHRAARVIQRTYRDWRTMRHDETRDRRLLLYSLMRYQQQELGRAVAQKQRQRDAQRAAALYGDSTAAMRVERQQAALELAKAVGADGGRAAEQEEMPLSHTFPQPGASRRALERREREAALHRDERLLALTQEHDAAHLRESPADCEARLGTMYEHPYHNPYINEEHQRTLGID